MMTRSLTWEIDSRMLRGERGNTMKGMHLLAVTVLLAVIGTTDALAMYNPRTGRFMQRDPGPGAPERVGTAGPVAGSGFIERDQYADGMNLYQYVGSRPIIAVDPNGTVLVVLSGLFQSCNSGETLGNIVGQAIANRIAQYDASGSADLQLRLLGMGGQGEEDRLQRMWREFLDRKTKDPCSLEQFVVIGHSDGATAMYRTTNAGVFSGKAWTPAYLGFVDLVRLDYGLGTVNTKSSADPSSHATLQNKPENTFVENFWQEHGAGWRGLWAGWKGRMITGADRSWNVGALALMRSGVQLNHFTLWEYPKLHQNLAESVTEYYERAVKVEMAGGKDKWARKQGEQW